jgi:GTPase SAR1 family protein
MSTLMTEGARVAILGSGGMGKTTLALAALHHVDVEEKYPHRHFVSCESANNAGDLISIIGSYLNIPPSKGLSRAIYGHFLDCGPAILVLDNMETPWEPLSTRAEVEEFLSLLADVPHLALLVSIPHFLWAPLKLSADHHARRRAAWESEMDAPIPGSA